MFVQTAVCVCVCMLEGKQLPLSSFWEGMLYGFPGDGCCVSPGSSGKMESVPMAHGGTSSELFYSLTPPDRVSDQMSLPGHFYFLGLTLSYSCSHSFPLKRNGGLDWCHFECISGMLTASAPLTVRASVHRIPYSFCFCLG